MTPLFKTTIVIWSDYDPRETELEELARDATSGGSYCSVQRADYVLDPTGDPDWDDTEFFLRRPSLLVDPARCGTCGTELSADGRCPLGCAQPLRLTLAEDP